MIRITEERKQAFYDLAKVYCKDLITPEFSEYLDNNFFTPPASRKYHAAYEGGLYDHSENVFHRLKALTENNGLTWKRPQSPFIVGMFHDLCKCDQYTLVNSDPPHYEFNGTTMLKGHGSKSVIILSQFINLTEEEMLSIRFHMGSYEKDEWDEFDIAIKKYENVFWAHTADMLACKVDKL